MLQRNGHPLMKWTRSKLLIMDCTNVCHNKEVFDLLHTPQNVAKAETLEEKCQKQAWKDRAIIILFLAVRNEKRLDRKLSTKNWDARWDRVNVIENFSSARLRGATHTPTYYSPVQARLAGIFMTLQIKLRLWEIEFEAFLLWVEKAEIHRVWHFVPFCLFWTAWREPKKRQIEKKNAM
jgi:hypothetical protein